MRFTPLELPGAYLLDLEAASDERGFFARTFCAEEFRRHGLDSRVAQCSLSHNRSRGTLRGLHYQAEPHEEAKVVRCVRGAIHDVILDLRDDSATFRRHVAVELSRANGRALYVPPGVAHGFLTLEDSSDVYYQMSVPFEPRSARGVRWDDPLFAIPWPEPPLVLSERDRRLPDFRLP